MSSTRPKPPTKRQLIADAQTAALEGRWADAVTINDSIVSRFPREAGALNRKGRALIEQRQFAAARDAYSEALKADPANMIARRNLQRLETLYARPEGAEDGGDISSATIPNASVFVEEVGKTWVDELANPADLGILAEVSPGAQLKLVVEGEKIAILGENDVRLGEVDARIAQRIITLIEGGNRYEVFALGVSSQSLRVILREVYRDPSQVTRISFPRQIRGTQDLMRERELLFQRDEADFQFGDDEDVDADDERLDPDIDPDADELDEQEEDAREFVDEANLNDDEEPDAM